MGFIMDETVLEVFLSSICDFTSRGDCCHLSDVSLLQSNKILQRPKICFSASRVLCALQ